MGVLDDLKAKREAREQQLAEQEARREKHQAFYEKHINPRLKKLYAYLNELTEHLNYLKPETTFGYPFPTLGEIDGFRQHGYRLSVDSGDRMQHLHLRFLCARESHRVALPPGGPADKLVDFLKDKHLDHQARRVRASAMSHWHLDIEFDCRIHCGIEFRANLETLTIDMEVINFPTWGRRALRYKPHEVNPGFHDELGRFLLGEESRLLTLKLSAEERQRIRELAEQERQRLRRETILARQYSPTNLEPDEESPSLLERLKPRR